MGNLQTVHTQILASRLSSALEDMSIQLDHNDPGRNHKLIGTLDCHRVFRKTISVFCKPLISRASQGLSA